MRWPVFVFALAAWPAWGNPVNDQIAALPEAKRQVLFAKLLSSSGERCPSVSRTFFQGAASNGAAFWSVACNGGKEWQVMVNGDSGGSTRILECSVLKSVGGGACWRTYKK